MKSAKKYICAVLSAAMIASVPCGMVFADEDVTPSALPSASPSASPEASAEPSASPSAAPQDKAMDMDLTATYYTTDTKNSYRVTFKTDSTLPQITAFEFTATFDGAKITATEVGSAFDTNGSVSKSITDDKTVKFTWKDGNAVSGSVILAGATIDASAVPSVTNISIDSFTAVCADGAKLTINPKLSVIEGVNMPELSDKAQTVYDSVLALPDMDNLSFYDENKKSLINLDIKYAQPANTAKSKYDALTAIDKRAVDTALSISNKSISDVDSYLTCVKAMQSVYGVMELQNCYDGLTDDSSAINYQFITKTAENVSMSTPSALNEAPTAAEEFKAATAKINEYNKIVNKNVDALKDKTYENYQTKIGSLKVQFTSAKSLNQLTYSKAFISAITMLANELYDDIDTNYTGNYKDYMLSDIDEIRKEIESGSEIYDNLPTFEHSAEVRIGYSLNITFERNNSIKDQEADVTVCAYDEDGNKVSEKTESFKSGSLSTVVKLNTMRASYKGNSCYSLKCYYVYDEISYYLGSSTFKALPAKTTNTGGSTSGGGSTGNTGNTGSGNFYPDLSPSKSPSATQAPNMANENPYTDIDNYDWAIEAIIGLTNAGIVNGMGDNEFNPAGNVTREQFCKMVVQLFGVSVNDTETDFADVDENAWYAPYITAAVQAGYVQGQSDEYFGVGESIMRQDMATILYRAANKSGNGVVLDFTDDASIASYARDAISELVGLGVMNGYEDGSFKPRGNATRAEAAKVIWGVYGII